MTGRSPHILIHALPELRPGIDRNTGPPLPVHVRRTICWRCAGLRSAFIFAITWKPAEITLCPRHLIWLGPPVRTHHGLQYDVHHLPDILHAQRRHYRLVRHNGRQATADALTEAADITAFWARHGIHSDRRKPLVHALLGRNPLTGRIPPGDPITPVVTYPETVGLAHVLAMPHSRELTHTADRRRIRQLRRDIMQHLASTTNRRTAPTIHSSAGSKAACTRSPA
ncbi:hypothetical protein [Plantactinospora sp. KLBMP9567]|uniref:hypothetical protein n=1 Tax=Plantactinospora sp. KLBMP9567 TaxID=3085900 RepID=UPI0029810F38|nr:hypothetical protein [Plantactinospora sp. KLBMP9567]MDW5323827.1 hypothetical protein [Plantactinospora sp. KLBMP9567]